MLALVVLARLLLHRTLRVVEPKKIFDCNWWCVVRLPREMVWIERYSIIWFNWCTSIIVTTRQKKVAHIMETLSAHCLNGLSDENCWILLLRSRAFVPKEEVSWKWLGMRLWRSALACPLLLRHLEDFYGLKEHEKNGYMWETMNCGSSLHKRVW